MKYTLFCIAFICSLCCYNSNSYAQERPTVPSSVNTVEDKVYALSLLWSEIKYNFVHIDQVNFDIDSLYRATMRRVLKTENDQDFYKEIDRFLVKFKDGHTELVIRQESGEENTDYPRYGTALFGDKFYFTSYRLHSDTDSLLLGAEIVEIEGIPTTEYVEKYVLPDITGSTPTYNLKVAGALLLNGKVHTRIKGKALTRAGKIVNFDVIRDGESTRTPDEQWWEPKSERKRNWRDKIALNWENDIAIVSIDKFWPEEEMCHKIDSIMQIVRKENPAGLVIDLRNNGGGSTNVAQHLQMYLTDADSLRTFGWQTRKNLGYGRAQGNYREEYEDYFEYTAYETYPPEIYVRDKAIEPIACPVVILMGTYSFSACEDFLVCISEMPGHPLLIGEETAGSTGAPLVIYLPHGAVARICTLRELYPYSLKPFVGKGVTPDIEVKPTIDDYLDGKDPVLSKALEVLNDH